MICPIRNLPKQWGDLKQNGTPTDNYPQCKDPTHSKLTNKGHYDHDKHCAHKTYIHEYKC